MAAAAERMVTAPRPRVSASVTPADAISRAAVLGDGPRAEHVQACPDALAAAAGLQFLPHCEHCIQ